MKLFDKYVMEAAARLQPYLNDAAGEWPAAEGQPAAGCCRVPAAGPAWPLAEKNPFIMERDTALELGGYPKESVSLILSTSASIDDIVGKSHLFLRFTTEFPYKKGQFAVEHGEKHLSFGKIVFLQTEELADGAVYGFQQSVQLADLRLRLQNVMTRTSSEQYLTNLRIGKRAMADGFTLEAMAQTMREHFLQVPHVRDAAVVLLVGDSPLYRQLLPIAEKVKDVTVALNTMFDGIDMDCGSCSLNEICDEVEGLREMHRNRKKG